jgi:hypothetical protein
MTQNTAPIIGWTIALGNPRDGFSLYGFFEDKYVASDSAAFDRSIGSGDWWILPVYKQENPT